MYTAYDGDSFIFQCNNSSGIIVMIIATHANQPTIIHKMIYYKLLSDVGWDNYGSHT